MTLSGQTIRQLCQEKITKPYLSSEGLGESFTLKYREVSQRPMVTPFVERSVSASGKSYGLSVAGYDIRVQKFQRYTDITDHIRMQAGDFCLASSVERIIMPNDVICFVKDKSSWAREGLCVQNTVLEPGWEGFITLELSFHRPTHYVNIKEGDPIAQLIFHRLDHAAEKPYSGKYQNQPDKPVEAIKEPIGE